MYGGFLCATWSKSRDRSSKVALNTIAVSEFGRSLNIYEHASAFYSQILVKVWVEFS